MYCRTRVWRACCSSLILACSSTDDFTKMDQAANLCQLQQCGSLALKRCITTLPAGLPCRWQLGCAVQVATGLCVAGYRCRSRTVCSTRGRLNCLDFPPACLIAPMLNAGRSLFIQRFVLVFKHPCCKTGQVSLIAGHMTRRVNASKATPQGRCMPAATAVAMQNCRQLCLPRAARPEGKAPVAGRCQDGVPRG